MATSEGKPEKEKLPVIVNKPIPLEFDLGSLCAFDTNPLDPQSYDADAEFCLQSTARDGAQLLINQILTAIPMKSTSEGVFAELPEPSTPLPREKPLPKPKEPTKWELFARKKGIKSRGKSGKLGYDNSKAEWVPKWGYMGKNKADESQWLVEVDDKKAGMDKDNFNPRKLSRQDRLDRIKKNERQMKKNLRSQGQEGDTRRPIVASKPRGVSKKRLRK